MDAKQTRQGVLLALAAYFIWGIAPAYFKLIYYVPADEILTHRVIWSFFFMVVLMSICRQWSYLKTLIQTPQKIFMLAVSAVLIGGNWLLFIWAVNNHHMLEASLGYFINPLVNIVLGMIFLGERFRRMQWLAVILAICGVLVQLWTFGSLPIIALGRAFSFAFYGLVRKKIAVEAQTGMLIETMWLLPVAAIYLFAIADSSTSHMGQNPMSLNLLLIAAGIVTTGVAATSIGSIAWSGSTIRWSIGGCFLVRSLDGIAFMFRSFTRRSFTMTKVGCGVFKLFVTCGELLNGLTFKNSAHKIAENIIARDIRRHLDFFTSTNPNSN